jgi:hypothetical protein
MKFVNFMNRERVKLKRSKIPLQWFINCGSGGSGAVVFDFLILYFREDFKNEIEQRNIIIMGGHTFFGYRFAFQFSSEADEAVFLLKVHQ